MLDPDLVLAAVVSAVQSMSAVVTALGGSTSRIIGHQYSWGKEHSLARSIRQLADPSILIAYTDMLGGQWDGMTVWKHRLEIWIRPKNAASGTNPVAVTAPHFHWLLMTSPVASISPGTLNIRTIRLLPNLAPVDAMPQLIHVVDEELSDMWCSKLVIPELGDD